MLIIDRETIKKIIEIEDILIVVREAFGQISRGQGKIPLRTQLPIDEFNGTGIFMPSYSPILKRYGIKIASVFTGNRGKGLPLITSVIVLNHGETGLPIAMMDGGLITVWRTGAASGVATDLLALKAAQSIAIIGCGTQALGQLKAICAVREIKEAYFFDIDPTVAGELIKKCREEFGEGIPKMVLASTPEIAIKQAQIVVTATTSSRPVFQGEDLQNGAHINAVGSFTPLMQEIGEDVLGKASKILVDSREGVLEESGDFIIPIKKGTFSPGDIHGEIGSLINGEITGRENQEEITLFKTVGASLLDLAVANLVYERVKNEGLGLNVDMGFSQFF